MSVNKNQMYQFDKQKPRNRVKTQVDEYPDLSKDIVYLDISEVAPSPSRDYFRLRVTSNKVCLTHWRISHKPKAIPVEETVDLANYAHEPNLNSEVSRVFGKDTSRYVMGLSAGQVDWIIRLPTKILARIMGYVGIRNLSKLAPVCKRFQEISSGNTLWSGFYRKYVRGGVIPEETRLHANYLGWKTTFFINRLQDRVFRTKKVRLGWERDEPRADFLEAQAKRNKEKRNDEATQRGSVSSTGMLSAKTDKFGKQPFKARIPANFVSKIPDVPPKFMEGKSMSSPGLSVKSYAQIRASLGLKPKAGARKFAI